MGQAARDATHAMSRRAEALLRALVGVHEAEVSFRAGGIAHVRVAAAGQSQGLLVRNIRSALLAGLGVAVEPPHIELVDPAAWVRAACDEGDATSAPEAALAEERAAVSAPAPGSGAAGNGHAAAGNGHGARNGHGTTGNGHGTTGNGHVPTPPDARRVEPVRSPTGRAEPLLRSPLFERVARGAAARGSEGQAARVDKVEVVRHAGRLRCRVVISAGAERFSAIADAADEPGAEIQLAGRVACDALRAGGMTSALFESATVAYLGGRIHVVVALGDWRNGEPQPRSGSVVAEESLEHATARAVVQAALAEPAA